MQNHSTDMDRILNACDRKRSATVFANPIVSTGCLSGLFGFGHIFNANETALGALSAGLFGLLFCLMFAPDRESLDSGRLSRRLGLGTNFLRGAR